VTAEVLAARAEPAAARAALEELWGRVVGLGWLAGARPRTVIQTGPGSPEAVAGSVAALASFLRERLGVERVELLDWTGAGAGGAALQTLAPGDAVQVMGVAAPTVQVPALWLEPFFLVTVTGVTPNPVARLAAVLAAQLRPLEAVGWRARRRTLVYEAHRLGGSDLALVCGGTPAERWWLASPSDVALDRVVAHAAGLDPRTLPDLEAIARHELPSPVALVDRLPGLEGCAGAPWRAALESAREGLGAGARYLVHDARQMRRNLRRVPHAVRRRLPALLRSGGAA
jgi:hypothetical protein